MTVNSINKLIDLIEDTVSAVLQYDREKYASCAQQLVNLMMLGFPLIINVYNAEKMSDMRDDALYWPGQLEKILKVLKSDDWLGIVDALYNETRPNLIELRDILQQRGLINV